VLKRNKLRSGKGELLPKTPDDLASELRKREFTSNADLEVVIKLYEKGYIRILEICNGTIDYAYTGWGDTEVELLKKHLDCVAGYVRQGKVHLPLEREGKVCFNLSWNKHWDTYSQGNREMLSALHPDELEVRFN